MILFSILLTAGLDLSLLEFQPEDVSGNYIVSEYDVSGDEFIAVEVPATELAESVALRTEATAETQDVVDAINSMNDDNNRYWELFLDSYPINVDHVLRSSYISSNSWKFSSSGGIASAGGNNDKLAYIPVSAGITYYISSVTEPSVTYYRYGVVNDLTSPTSVTNFVNDPSDLTSISVTASQDGFLCFYISLSKEIGFTANWTTIEQESYTLSELGNAVMEIRSNNDMKFRILIFLTLINFAYPIVISSFKNFFGGGKNV